MNKKITFLGIMLLIALMLSGCVWYGGYGHHGYPYGHGDYNYRDDYNYRGYSNRGWDGYHSHGSGRGSYYWR